MSERETIFESKEKRIYSTDDPETVCIHHKDMATAFGGIKQGVIKNKGKYVNSISSLAQEALIKAGISTQYIRLLNEREQLCRRITPIPIQFIVRNRLVGTGAKMLGVKNGTEIPNVVYEMRYRCESLDRPMINDHHAVALGLCSYDDLKKMHAIVEKSNKALKTLFHKAGIELVDFKMELGFASDGSIIVSDGISPDNSRLWDEATGEVLDKDRFRHDLGDVSSCYKEVMDRLIKATEK